MQSINNLQDIIKVYKTHNTKNLTTYNRIWFGSEIIEVGSEYKFTNYINNTNLKDFIIDFSQISYLEKIIKINKELDFDNFEILDNLLIIKINKAKYEIKISQVKLGEDYEKSVLIELKNKNENKEFLGKIDYVTFHNLLKIAKTQKIQNEITDAPYRNFFVNNGYFLLTNKIQMINNIISNLKDCILNIEKLTEHYNCEYLNVYADADFYYYESNLITNKIDKNEFQKVYNQTVEVYNDALKNAENCFFANLQNFKLKKVKNIRLNFAESKMIYNDNFENTFNDKFDIFADNLVPENKLLPIIEFSYANFVNIYNLLEIKDCVLIKIPNEINKPFFIENHLIMPIRVESDNYVEYTKKEYNTTNELQKEYTEVKESKPKKVNLKQVIKTAPKKSKYFEPVTEVEVIENNVIESKEISKEIIKYIAPEVSLEVVKKETTNKPVIKKLAAPKQSKPAIKELSNTVITPDFEFIDFIYKSCFNDLENLDF